MGREIRRVPADWEHPRYTADNCTDRRQIGQYMPLYDNDYESAAREWIAGFDEHRAGKGNEWAVRECAYYWEYCKPPTAERYRTRKWAPEEATYYQMYQTVNEGTPMTPPMPTLEALVDYLVNVGDEWDGKWTRAAAERFAKDQWAPSLMINNGVVMTPATMHD